MDGTVMLSSRHLDGWPNGKACADPPLTLFISCVFPQVKTARAWQSRHQIRNAQEWTPATWLWRTRVWRWPLIGRRAQSCRAPWTRGTAARATRGKRGATAPPSPAGEGFPEDALSWRLRPRAAGPEDRSDRGPRAGSVEQSERALWAIQNRDKRKIKQPAGKLRQ